MLDILLIGIYIDVVLFGLLLLLVWNSAFDRDFEDSNVRDLIESIRRDFDLIDRELESRKDNCDHNNGKT